MKRTLITAALLSAFIAMPASAHTGMGGGMMGGGAEGGRAMMDGPGAGMAGDCHSGGYATLDLTSEQRAKLQGIERDLWRKQRELMGRMHQQDFHMHDLYAAGVDEARARKAFDAMTAAHKEMFEASLDARKRIDAVLTEEQRKRMQRP